MQGLLHGVAQPVHVLVLSAVVSSLPACLAAPSRSTLLHSPCLQPCLQAAAWWLAAMTAAQWTCGICLAAARGPCWSMHRCEPTLWSLVVPCLVRMLVLLVRWVEARGPCWSMRRWEMLGWFAKCPLQPKCPNAQMPTSWLLVRWVYGWKGARDPPTYTLPSSQPHVAQARVLHDAAVTALAPGPSGNALASASADGTLRLWETASLLTCTAQLGAGGTGTAVSAAAWAGPTLLAAAGDAGLNLWDVRQAGTAAPAAAAALGARVLSVAAHTGADGQQLLITGDALGRVSVFDARTLAQPLQQHTLHGDAVHALAVAAAPGVNGSKHVASGSDDGSIQLLKVADLAGSCQLAPAKQDGEAPCYVRALVWSGSHGEQRLVRGGWDQQVALALH